MADSSGLLFNPDTYDPVQFDPRRASTRAVIDWFEQRGKTKLLRDDLDALWVSDFVDFIKRERISTTFLTPSEYGIGDPNKRWDTSRNAALSEISASTGWRTGMPSRSRSRPRADLADRQHQSQGARGRATRGGRRDGIRPLRARARRGHLQHRWGLVEKLTTVVTLKLTSENFDCTWMERWLRDNVIGRIPGGRHAPE